MREHIVSWGGTDNRQQTTTENAKVEASLNLRFAESGTKKKGKESKERKESKGEIESKGRRERKGESEG